MAELYADIRKHLFRFMRSDAREWVRDHFETYVSRPQLHSYPLVLHHGDFGGSNILHNRETLTVAGIVDFGFAAVGDPAHDIAAVSTYGASFMERFRTAYPGIDALLERAAFYRGTFALQEALHGLKNGDEGAFRAGMAQYV
jgi:aminoglycoside 2''-phosphotransferase